MRRSLNRDRKSMSLHTLLHTKLNLSFKEWTKADKHQALVSTDQIHRPDRLSLQQVPNHTIKKSLTHTQSKSLLLAHHQQKQRRGGRPISQFRQRTSVHELDAPPPVRTAFSQLQPSSEERASISFRHPRGNHLRNLG